NPVSPAAFNAAGFMKTFDDARRTRSFHGGARSRLGESIVIEIIGNKCLDRAPRGRWWSPPLAFQLSAILADSLVISLILPGFFRISLPLGVIDKASRSRAKACGIRPLPSSAEVWPVRPPQRCWDVPASRRC